MYLGLIFRRFARRTSEVVGSARSFIIAVALIAGWAATGPLFGFSDTWQLVINTSTTIITFLMVFLIQNTQNRDARAVHLKLDELIRAVADARLGLLDLESMSDEELAHFQEEFRELRMKKAAEEQMDLEGSNRRQQGRRIEDRLHESPSPPLVPLAEGEPLAPRELQVG